MVDKMVRVGIVGASSLAGKELSDALSESAFAGADVVLLDEGNVSGQLAVSGDEVAFIQRLEASSFGGLDFAFFAGAAEVTKKHWKSAKRAGASIVDISYALESEQDVLVRAPWVTSELRGGGRAVGAASDFEVSDLRAPDLKTGAVVAAHPAAVIIALVGARLQAGMKVDRMVMTLLVPASEYGREAMDELHKQTVSLLSFQSLPKERYDAQVSFNVVRALGEEAKMGLAATANRIRHHYGILGNSKLPELSLEMLHTPVFHGYVASVMVELAEEVPLEGVQDALSGDHIKVVRGKEEMPSNVSATGQAGILVHVRPDAAEAEAKDLASRRFWLWLAADNLKMGADNAICCAGELRRLRPLGKVQ